LKYWYVEDAGGGCRAFSEVLVLVCENPPRIYKRYLPLTWDKNITLEEMACRKVREMMREAGVTREDYLYVCSSNIFHRLHQWLTENGYRWETAHMDGLAHEVAEQAFQQQIIAAGFPADIKLEGRNYKEFYRLVNAWINQDPARRCFCKDMQVRCKPERLRYLLRANTGRARICSRCHKKIAPYSPMVQYRFKQYGKQKYRCYHPACSPVQPEKSKLEQIQFTWGNDTLHGAVLPAKETGTCIICGQSVAAGSKAVHAVSGNKIIFGHPACFTRVEGRT